MVGTYITQEKLTLAQILRDKGVPWPAIAERIGFSVRIIRRRIDPQFMEEQKLRDQKKARLTSQETIDLKPPKPPLIDHDKLLERLRAGYR